jgi:hypothetical protein
MSEAKYWKVLNADRSVCHGGTGQWPAPGEWLAVSGPLVACKRGLHLCRRGDLIQWLGPTIWEVEADETGMVVVEDKVVVRRARLVRQLDTWNERTTRLFACDCGEAVLPIYERTGKSPAPREALAAARRFAHGEATIEELDAARDAAWAAARDAAWDAAEAAAGAATWDAARAAAWAAAWAAAEAAARDAAWAAARDAARAAAGDAAGAAAGDAAWDAAWAAQTNYLFTYLYPKERPKRRDNR